MIRHSAKDQIFINRLTEITLANLGNENFGVEELAREAGISRYRLGKKLHELTNRTIKQFITEIRLQKAFEMLRDEDLTASEVAYKVGYGSATYFNTCFNEYFGYPPGSVKKREVITGGEVNQIPAVSDKEKKLIISGTIIIISVGILFILIIIYLVYSTIIKPVSERSSIPGGNHDKSIAVLPFKNLSDSTGNQYFVDGIAEDILTLLSKVHDLRVISRTSVEQFRNGNLPVSEIARKLKVKYVIEGSVQKSGNMFRLWIQLIDAKTGNHLWAEVYDGEYSIDIFDFQSTIARKVAASLNVVLTPGEEHKISSNPTNEILAYDLCLKGDELVRKWYLSGEEQYLKLSANAFKNALKIDPDYVTALLGMAQVLLKSGSYDSSLVYYQKVLTLDKENVVALVGIGGYYLYTHIPDSALRYFQISMDADPNGVKSFWNYLGAGQVFFMYRNETMEAFSCFQKAFDLGGYAWPEIHDNISLLFSSIGDYSRAYKYMHTSLSMTSSCSYIRKSFYILSAMGEHDNAFAFLDSIGMITPCEPTCDMMRFYLYTIQRKFDKAEICLNKAIKAGYKLEWDDYLYKSCLYKETGRSIEDLSIIRGIAAREDSILMGGKSFWASETAIRAAAGYAVLGDNKKAIGFLKLLEKYGCNDNPFPLMTFPGFNDLKNNPEFKAIVKRIEDNRASLRQKIREMEQHREIKL